MKVWQLSQSGRKHLQFVDLPEPKPGPKQILVRTHAVSLNYRDKAILDGTYPFPISFPFVLGSDLAGEVIAVGNQITRFSVGDRVVSVFKPLWLDGIPSREAQSSTLGSSLPGVLAEYVLFSEDGLLKYPDYLAPSEAAILPVVGVTVWGALFKHGQIKPAHTVLVQGSGGVSVFGLQLAQSIGSSVIATSRSPAKLDRLKQLGAFAVIDTLAKPAWEEEARRLTLGRGVDQILEVIGGQSVQRSIRAAAFDGHIAVIGFLENQSATISLPLMLVPNVRLQGIAVGSRKDFQDLLTHLQLHPLKPVIDHTYPFKDLHSALDHLDRGPFGKIVIEI